jgi:hypothetical protein
MGSLHDIGEPAKLLLQHMKSLPNLRQLPWMERLMMRRTFQGEEIRIGPPQQWLGRSWDLRLASVGDIIYKIALEAHASDRSDAEELSIAVVSKLQQDLGQHSQPDDAIFLWDVDDGNVVLQFANVGGDRRLMLFLTSSITRTFTPR